MNFSVIENALEQALLQYRALVAAHGYLAELRSAYQTLDEVKRATEAARTEGTILSERQQALRNEVAEKEKVLADFLDKDAKSRSAAASEAQEARDAQQAALAQVIDRLMAAKVEAGKGLARLDEDYASRREALEKAYLERAEAMASEIAALSARKARLEEDIQTLLAKFQGA